MTLNLADGRTLSATATVNKGDVEDPYAVKTIVGKFQTLTEPVWGKVHAERIIEAVRTIDSPSNNRLLYELLRATPKTSGAHL